MLLACVLGALCVASLGSACSSQPITPPTRPFSSTDVITGFGRHDLRLEVFDPASAGCGDGTASCPSTGRGPAPIVQLRVAGQPDVLSWMVFLYTAPADAAQAVPTGTGVFRYLRRANVVVMVVADTRRVAPAFRGYLVSGVDKLRELRAALAALEA